MIKGHLKVNETLQISLNCIASLLSLYKQHIELVSLVLLKVIEN